MNRTASRVLFMASIALASACRGSSAPDVAVAMHRGNAQRTGVLATAGVAKPTEALWRVDANLGESPLVVAGGRLFFEGKGRLHAVEVSTGKTVWTHGREASDEHERLPPRRPPAPAVANDIVYWTSPEGLFALDAETGQVRWRIDSPSPNILAATVANGTVYFAGTALHAVNAETGQERWRSAANTEPGAVFSAGPAVDDGLVFIGRSTTTGGELIAIDAATGQEQWKVQESQTSKEEQGYVLGLAIQAGVVYFSFIEGTASFRSADARTGREKWRRSQLHYFLIDSPEPVVADGLVYFIAMEASKGFEGPASLYALDVGTGQERWRRELDLTFDDRFRTELVFADGLLYTGVGKGLVAIAAKTGAEQWHFKTDEHVYPGPTLSNGVLYFGMFSGVQGVLQAVR